jgi:hypothetical protein
MYSILGTSTDNTGQQEGDKSRGIIKKVFIYGGTLVPADFVDADTFLAALTAKAKLDKNDPEKVFVINESQDIADNSEANKEASLNLGFSTTLLEGKPKYTIKVFAGSDLVKRYRTFNNQSVRVIELDSNGVFWVTEVGGNARGFQAKLFFVGNKGATGQNVEEGVCTYTLSILSNSEYIDNAKWMETTGNVEDIVPLIDVALTNISHAGNVWKIGMYIPGSNLIGAYNIFDTKGAEIAALAFTAGTGTNYGTPLAITSVAVDNALKALTVTFDATAYNALAAGTKIKLIPPTPAALDAGDVPETELLPVILTK